MSVTLMWYIYVYIYFPYRAIKYMTNPFRCQTSLPTGMLTFDIYTESVHIFDIHLKSAWMCLQTSDDWIVSGQVAECPDVS